MTHVKKRHKADNVTLLKRCLWFIKKFVAAQTPTAVTNCLKP